MGQQNDAAIFKRLDELELWQLNYNQGDVAAIARSIQTFGFNGRVATHGATIMAGNHAHQALVRLREAGSPFPGGKGLRLEDDGEWSVLTTPLDHLSRQQAEAFAIADNHVRDLAKSDDERLAELLRGIAEADDLLFQATGYDDDDLAKLLAQTFEGQRPDLDAEPEVERAEELRTKWGTEVGQIWQLGAHRLACGDSTDPDVVQALMQGERARLFATDPPYLVDYTGTNHPGGPSANKDWTGTYRDFDRSEQGDGLYRGYMRAAVDHAIAENAAWYCWHASRRQAMVEAVWGEFGAFVHQQIIWAKDRGILTRSWYLWQHEPCFFGWVRGHEPIRVADNYPTTVWQFPTAKVGENVDHPTIKPVEVFEIPMLQHTAPGDICYEPFSGSGTQIIAGERTGRRVYAIELAPEFVAVALERWHVATGEMPVLVATTGDGEVGAHEAVEAAPLS